MSKHMKKKNKKHAKANSIKETKVIQEETKVVEEDTKVSEETKETPIANDVCLDDIDIKPYVEKESKEEVVREEVDLTSITPYRRSDSMMEGDIYQATEELRECIRKRESRCSRHKTHSKTVNALAIKSKIESLILLVCCLIAVFCVCEIGLETFNYVFR